MRTLLVLGNGFDRWCHLPSSYNDFFTYEEKHNLNYGLFEKNFALLKENYDKGGTVTSKDVGTLPRFGQGFTPWDAMFILLHLHEGWGNETLKWCDVEEAMYLSLQTGSGVATAKFLWERVLLTVNRLLSYHYRQWGSVPLDWYDMTTLVGAEIILTPYFSNLATVKESDFYAFLLKQLRDFENRFSSYIFQCSNKNEDYQKRADLLFEKLLSSLPERDLDRSSIDVASFNYSAPELPATNIYHINGSVRSSPVFGIGNGPVVESAGIFRKSERSFEIEQTELGLLDSSYSFSEPANIIIFGHSLNPQDYPFFFSLFDSIGMAGGIATIKGYVVFAYAHYSDDPGREDSERFDAKRLLLKAYFNERKISDQKLMNSLNRNAFLPNYEVTE
jgi:hypothetical protein